MSAAEEHDHRSAHHEGGEKSIFGKIKDKITGKDEEHHESAKSAPCNTCTTDTRCDDHRVISKEVEEHERQAHALRKGGEQALKHTEKEFTAAERAQQQARLAAEHANVRTAQALNEQERGQSMMAESGAQMIEAGAKMQQQANTTQVGQVPFNEHRQGEVQQTTCVSAAGQEAAQRAHEQETVRSVQYSEAH
uniref:Uncharacterized protein n=1 Tax=Panagrolaimus sp. JU765 TaxID=591449 RepID=A0AC34QCV9_9BILA